MASEPPPPKNRSGFGRQAALAMELPFLIAGGAIAGGFIGYLLDDYFHTRFAALDANDLLYQVNASRNYDPSTQLGKIKAQVMYINSGDDFINPPELGIAEREVKKIQNAKFVLIPASEQTHGHG